MPGFGPFYPQLLQKAVNHAERLANMLRNLAAMGPADQGAVWITGRAEEIACFVGAVTRDWRATRLSDGRAAQGIDRYVDGLHHDLCARLGIEALPCCSAALDETAEPLASFGVSIAGSDSSTPGTTTLLRGLDYPVEPRR
jgi:hypothetical protein